MRVSSFFHLATAVALAVQASPPGFGQATPHGVQFQVNTFTPNAQQKPAVAADSLGRMVVVWQSEGEIGDPDGSVEGQRYAADGTPQGAQFRANSFTSGFQGAASVARRPSGEFVVVWQSATSSGNDNSFNSIQARRFAADGTPLGAEFQVNAYTTYFQNAPDVAVDDAGEFIVVWQSRGSFGNDQDGDSVQGRRFSAIGVPLGAEFQVNNDTTGYQTRPRVAASPAGDFWVVYQTAAAVAPDPDWSVQARFYDATGTPWGGSFTLNTFTSGIQSNPEVAADDAGNFLAVWESPDSPGTDTDLSIQGYLLNSLGEPLGDDFQVNTHTTGNQFWPVVTGYANFGFVVSWESGSTGGTDTSSSIQARQLAGPLSSDFQVNTFTPSIQTYPAVAADPRGNFVVVWSSDGSGASDTSDYSIQGQRYDALFRDGFASNDTSRWSAAVP